MSPFFEITPDMLEMLDDPIDRFNEALRREIKSGKMIATRKWPRW